MRAWCCGLLAVLALAAPARAAAGSPAQGADPCLAVICYHRFGTETAKDPYKISLKRLRAQLAWLREDGWQGVGLSQVAAAQDGRAALPPKAVLLTVDDGYKAGMAGAEAFEDAGYRGVFFVNPGSIGGRAFMSWDEVRSLESRGHAVASHSGTHPNLAKVPPGKSIAAWRAWLDEELRGSRLELERRLGHPVTALAWPFGAYDLPLIRAARAAGYDQLYTVSGGLNLGSTLDRWRLRRILLMGHPALAAFQRHLGTLPVAASAKGLEEGALIFRSQLPRNVRVQGEGLRAGLAGREVVPSAEGRWLLPADLKEGFHYLVLEQGRGPGLHRTPLLFQVAPDDWAPYYRSLPEASPDPTRDHADRP
jgi:peptidoglycan/xylan/chitin deacetylase (PgdA/CDA1 family)